MSRILVLGNADFKGKIIGAGIYTAVGLARLNSRVSFLAKVNSENSEELLTFLEKNDVDTDCVVADSESALISAKDFENLDLSDISTVYFSGEALAKFDIDFMKELCRLCREQETDIVFDPDFSNISDNSKDIINEFATLSDVFVPSIEDAKALCGLENPEEIADHYLKLGTKKVVVTLDKKGAFYKSNKESGTAPTFRADKVVDTEGAGDAFAAGLISGISEDIPLGEAVVRANACGSMAIQSKGVLDSLPTMQMLQEYMLSHRFVVDGCKEF